MIKLLIEKKNYSMWNRKDKLSDVERCYFLKLSTKPKYFKGITVSVVLNSVFVVADETIERDY